MLENFWIKVSQMFSFEHPLQLDFDCQGWRKVKITIFLSLLSVMKYDLSDVERSVRDEKRTVKFVVAEKMQKNISLNT